MKTIIYNGEAHTLKEWIEILKLSEEATCDTANEDLADFAEELIFDGRITNENLYKAYTLWSDDGCMPRSVFAKRIAIVFKEHRPDLRQFRTNQARGWQRMTEL